jgi:HD-GYP domain-containing protein (c-di-GMP phosphodiesterase class II)
MYEALILPRPQRPPFPAKEAARIVKKGSGILFDPALIKVFEQMLKDNLVSRGDIWKE